MISAYSAAPAPAHPSTQGATKRLRMLARRILPLLAWPVAVFLGYLGALCVLSPYLLGRVFGVVLLAWCLSRIIARPVNAMYTMLWVYPWYQIARFAVWGMYPNAPFFFISQIWLEVLLGVAFAGVLARAASRREPLTITAGDIPFVLLLLANLYGLLLAFAQQAWLTAGLGFCISAAPVTLYFVLRWTRPSAAQMLRIITMTGVTFALLAVLSFLDYFLHPAFMLHLYSMNRPGFFHGSADQLYQQFSLQYFRMQSLLMEENVWGELCGCVSLIAVAAVTRQDVFRGQRRRVRLGLWGVLLLALPGLILSMSRGAVIGFAAGVGTLLAVHEGRGRITRMIAVTAVLLTLAYSILSTDGRVRQITARLQEPAKWQGLDSIRAWQWEKGLISFREIPSGVGLGGAGYGQQVDRGNAFAGDCIYLRVLAELGIPGSILWSLGTLGIGGVLARRHRAVCAFPISPPGGRAATKSATDRPLLEALGAGLLAVLTSLCVHGVSGNTFDYYCVPMLFFLFCALYQTWTDRLLHGSIPEGGA